MLSGTHTPADCRGWGFLGGISPTPHSKKKKTTKTGRFVFSVFWPGILVKGFQNLSFRDEMHRCLINNGSREPNFNTCTRMRARTCLVRLLGVYVYLHPAPCSAFKFTCFFLNYYGEELKS